MIFNLISIAYNMWNKEHKESIGKVSHQSDNMVKHSRSNFDFESNSLHLLTILEIILEFLVILIGNILCLIIFHYERFGGDPMKRGLVNKFISTICLTMGATNFWHACTLVLRISFGPFPLGLASVFILSTIYGVLFLCMNVICVFTLKILQIKAFYFINGLNEDFWFLMTVILASVLCWVRRKHHILSRNKPPFT